MMTENKSNTEQNSENNKPTVDEQEIDLMDILRRIIGIRKAIYKAAGLGLVIGIIVALSIPKQYTVKVILSPEMGDSKGGNRLAGLAASFLGSDATMSEGTDALNASLSSDIVSSTPFLLELFDIKVVTSEKKNIVLSTYLEEQSSPWWNYVIGLPGMIIGSVKSMFVSEDEKNVATNGYQEGIIELTKKEAKKIDFLRRNIFALMDTKTAITQVSVTLQDAKVTAVVADSVVRKLQKCIISYRTSKAKDDCLYLEKLFKERQSEYYAVQRKYANYVDSHDDLILQSVRTEQERLQSDMSLAYQVYSQVANQLQVARAKVQEVKPVFAVVEPAVVPQQPSGMGLKVYVLLFAFLIVICTIVWAIIGKKMWEQLRKIK